jgi:surfeit locus 1 family protein
MSKTKTGPVWKLPVLLLLAVLMVLVMLRLAVWQLDRAEQKRQILSDLQARSDAAELNTESLSAATQTPEFETEYRYRQVHIDGQFLADQTLFVDRQVMQTQVGYLVVTPFRLANTSDVILVARGWVSAGDDRQVLPEVATPTDLVELQGRLNALTPPPPLWDERYQVAQQSVWQFLPRAKLEAHLGHELLPLMIELAPSTPHPIGLKIQWPAIDDQWVAKHSAYAFQWFAMAGSFTLACLVLVFRRKRSRPDDTPA